MAETQAIYYRDGCGVERVDDFIERCTRATVRRSGRGVTTRVQAGIFKYAL
jgi:hypothetical protein